MLYFSVCLYFGVGNTKVENSLLGGVSVRGGGREPTDFCIKLWILTRVFIWTLGFWETVTTLPGLSRDLDLKGRATTSNFALLSL